MRSREVSAVMKQISEASGRYEKLDILGSYIEDPFVKRLLKFAYDPSINFYVTSERLFDIFSLQLGGSDFGDEVFELLDRLSNQVITGHAAISEVEAFSSNLDADSRSLLMGVFDRSFNLGLNVISINSICPDLIEVPAYMRCATQKEVDISKWDWSKGMFVQPKLDGEFLNFRRLPDGGVTLSTREGSIFPGDYLHKMLGVTNINYYGGFEIHGELRVRDASTKFLERKTSNGLLNSVLKGGKLPENFSVSFVAWDFVRLEEIMNRRGSKPYRQRFAELMDFVKSGQAHFIDTIYTREVTSMEDAFVLRDHFLKLGDEGVVVKDPSSPWKHGKNLKIVKLKAILTNNLRVIGFTEGKGKYTGLVGALSCTSEDGTMLVNVSGFSEETRHQITDNKKDWMHRIVEVQHGGVIEAVSQHSLPSLIEPRLLNDMYLSGIDEADSLLKIRGT